MTDDVIHGCADRFGKSAVVQVGRNGPLHIHYVVVTDAVELFSRHPGDDVLADHVQHLRGQAAGGAHFFLFIRSLDRYVHGGRTAWLPAAGYAVFGSA